MEEANTSFTTIMRAHSDLSANDLAVVGLQEMMRWNWLDVRGLGVISMLSVRARQAARNGRCWRWAVREMFPRHPFEVDPAGFSMLSFIYVSG